VKRVTRAYLARDPLEVAPDLLGKHLVRVDGSRRRRVGRIVEVEAYLGEADPASHAYRGPTPRTQVMFGPAGHLYVYRSYGIHWCANVVCGDDGVAAAVLIRALEPVAGIEAMRSDRPRARRVTDLASGPGKLCAALAITGADGGADLCARAGAISLEVGDPPGEPVWRGPRVGISAAVDHPWRFWLAGNPHVSGPRTRPG
jgi:DNA-3-methyladenine glycosylase